MAEQKETKLQTLDAGQLALRCAQFFMTLSQSCFEFYNKYNREKERKSKLIKKAQKQKPRQIKRLEGQEQINQDLKKKLPKKPLTAYIIYFQQKKPNFVERYPGLNLSDLTKLIAKEWKEIDCSQRKPYLAQAQQDRKRYETQMKQFKLKYGTITVNNEQDNQDNVVIQNQIQNQSLSNGQQQNAADKKSDKNDYNMDVEKPEDSNENQAENQNQNQGQNQAQNENESQNAQANEESSEKEQDEGQN